MPGHALIFMQECMKFAQVDILDAYWIYDIVFDFKPTESFTPNFEMFGIDDKNFIRNSGSYFVFFFGFIIVNLSLILINRIAIYCAKRQKCRKLGIKVFSKSYIKDTFYAA
jgi:hypothetical protein